MKKFLVQLDDPWTILYTIQAGLKILYGIDLKFDMNSGTLPDRREAEVWVKDQTLKE